MFKPFCIRLSVRLSDEAHYFLSVNIALKVALERLTCDGADFHPGTCFLSYSGDYVQLKGTTQMKHYWQR
jgi:hypothetical protein